MKHRYKATLEAEFEVEEIFSATGDVELAINKQLRESNQILNPKLISVDVRMDMHTDLPLVSFEYPTGPRPFGDYSMREIRMIKMDSAYVDGYEAGTGKFKRFLKHRIRGGIRIISWSQRDKE